jgi:cytoskeletal protein CcmA (bactofilin family)
MWRKQEEQKVPPSPQNVVVTPPPAQFSTQPSVQSTSPTSAPQAAPPVTYSAPAPKNAVSIVCKGISIRGEVWGDEDLQIDGELSGTVKLVGARVSIGPEGRVAGNIQAREIIVRGTLKGNLRASERILMGSTGRWEGDGVSPRLAIEEGATVRGNLEVADAPEKKAVASAPAAAPAPTKVEKPAVVASTPAAAPASGGNGVPSPAAVRTENTANVAGSANDAKPVPVN